MKKVYVKETEQMNSDGECIITIETYTSKPKFFNYIVFLDK